MEVEKSQGNEILGGDDIDVEIEDLNGRVDKAEEPDSDHSNNIDEDDEVEKVEDVSNDENITAGTIEDEALENNDREETEEVKPDEDDEGTGMEALKTFENEESKNEQDKKEDFQNVEDEEDTQREILRNYEEEESHTSVIPNVDILKERENGIEIEPVEAEDVKEKVIEAPVFNRTAAWEERNKDIPKTEENKENGGISEQNNNSVKSSISKFGAPVKRKEKGMFKVVQTEKCAACQKTVYAMEKLEMNGHIYHKNCFKCSHCSARLTAKTFSMNEGVIYCVNHFKQLFARKGNYDEGFGRQQYKKKWQGDKPEGATA